MYLFLAHLTIDIFFFKKSYGFQLFFYLNFDGSNICKCMDIVYYKKLLTLYGLRVWLLVKTLTCFEKLYFYKCPWNDIITSIHFSLFLQLSSLQELHELSWITRVSLCMVIAIHCCTYTLYIIGIGKSTTCTTVSIPVYG